LWSVYEDLESQAPELRARDAARISSLTSMVLHTLLNRSTFVIMLTHEGVVKTINLDQADQSRDFFIRHDLWSKTFLCVSLTEVMLDSFRKVDVEVLSQMGVLTAPEAEVIRLLHQDQLKSVVIGLEAGRECDLFELAGENDRVKVLLDLLWKSGYHRITWASKDGRITYFDCPTEYQHQSV